MTELALPQDQIIALRARAHRLDPVVLLGAAGLSEAVFGEIDRALRAHGLIKVRAGKTERGELTAMLLAIADRLGAARIQAIGHTLVLFRPLPEPEEADQAPPKRTTPRAPAAKRARPAERTGQRARDSAVPARAAKRAPAARGSPPRARARQR